MLISFGAVIGRVSPAQVALMTIFEIFFYSLNKELLCVGLIDTLDMGGTIFVHLFGAYFGLTISKVLGHKRDMDKFGKECEAAGSNRVADVFSLLGTTLLWI